MFFLLLWQLLFVINDLFTLLDLASVCFFFFFVYCLCTFALYLFFTCAFLHITFLFSLSFWLNLTLDRRGTCPPSLEVIFLWPYDFNLVAIIDGYLRLSISQ